MMQRRRPSNRMVVWFLWYMYLSAGICCAFVMTLPSSLLSPSFLLTFRPCPKTSTGNRNVLSSSSSFALLGSSFSEDHNVDDDDDSSSALDQMRRSLESSWNAQTMGDTVPSDPQSAAKAAAESLITAASSHKTIMMVDLLLPSYDITQGFNLYDDVMAVEFCIALLNNFQKGKSVILVKDQKALTSVQRVLDARERRAMEQRQQEEENNVLDWDEVEEDDDDEDEDDDDGIVAAEETTPGPVAVEYYDDFGGGVGKADDDDDNDDNSSSSISNAEQQQAPPTDQVTPATSSSISTDKQDDDVDAFRKQLMSSWGDTSDETTQGRNNPVTTTDDEASSSESPPKQPSSRKRAPPPPSSTSIPKKSYRLASMLGNDKIAKGPDMMGDVITALRKYALPREEEDVICILSATTKEEMLAVRKLVSKYDESKKTIILVNCKFDPMPRELLSAETVYSILPLVVKPTVSETNLFGGSKEQRQKEQQQEQQQPPKVVVMRRYPGDWEIYVDANGSSGFELVDSAKASQTNKKGPSMEWIAGCVKRHLQTKFGQ